MARLPVEIGKMHKLDLDVNVIKFTKYQSKDQNQNIKKLVPSGAATCSEGFVKCFMIVPQAVGQLHCSCQGAQEGKGKWRFQKTYCKQVAAPDCRV